VVVTAPGPGSGKMATCISQLYHDNQRGIKSGYAKFETFPIWNLPLRHPINLAYEAATADLADVNMIDPYHLEAYGISAVNYNRDIEIFPVLNRMFDKIFGSSPYKSPTDMGVNMAGYCIVDDAVCQEAARQEIIRRYLKALVDRRNEKVDDAVVDKIDSLLKANDISLSERKVHRRLQRKSPQDGRSGRRDRAPDGPIITGKTSPLLGATSAMILNALKYLAGISDDVLLLPKAIIEPVCSLKVNDLGGHNPGSTSMRFSSPFRSRPSPIRSRSLAMAQLPKLRGAQSHSSVILAEVDCSTLKKLGIDHTSEPIYETKKLYHAK
jgi:uncharacterized protein (UPF0371 family)